MLGSLVNNQLIGKINTNQLMSLGLGVSILGAITMSIGMTNLWMLLGSILVIFIGLNILLPIVLSHALLGFEDVIGTASGLFSFGYYILISLLSFLMSLMHNGSIFVLPVYILIVVGGMVLSLIVVCKN